MQHGKYKQTRHEQYVLDFLDVFSNELFSDYVCDNTKESTLQEYISDENLDCINSIYIEYDVENFGMGNYDNYRSNITSSNSPPKYDLDAAAKRIIERNKEMLR